MTDVKLMEDTSDTSSINLYKWFKDINNDPLFFKCDHGQKHINVTIHQQNGTVLLIPEKDWNGQEILTFYANDSVFEISDQVTITVIGINDAPGLPTILEPKDGAVFKNTTSINLTATCSEISEENNSRQSASFKDTELKRFTFTVKEASSLEETVLEYAKERKGDLDVTQCALELRVPSVEVEKALEKLGVQGKIKIQRESR